MNRKAFTLIELLVVVAIIGILAAVGVVAYNGYTGAAKKKVTEANHKIIVKYAQNEIAKCMMGESKVLNYNGVNLYNCSEPPARRTLIVYALEKIFNEKIHHHITHISCDPCYSLVFAQVDSLSL